MERKVQKESKKANVLEEGVDYYFENELMVLTAHYLLRRGYCCGNGCRHCPYDDQSKKVSSSSRD